MWAVGPSPILTLDFVLNLHFNSKSHYFFITAIYFPVPGHAHGAPGRAGTRPAQVFLGARWLLLASYPGHGGGGGAGFCSVSNIANILCRSLTLSRCI